MIDWADDNKARNLVSVVKFPNPLAPDIQIHVSWGTRLVFCVESSEEHSYSFNKIEMLNRLF